MSFVVNGCIITPTKMRTGDGVVVLLGVFRCPWPSERNEKTVTFKLSSAIAKKYGIKNTQLSCWSFQTCMYPKHRKTPHRKLVIFPSATPRQHANNTSSALQRGVTPARGKPHRSVRTRAIREGHVQSIRLASCLLDGVSSRTVTQLSSLVRAARRGEEKTDRQWAGGPRGARAGCTRLS